MSADSEMFEERVKAGDSAAMEEMAGMYAAYLRKIIASRLDDRLSARVGTSDLIQETLMEAVRRISKQEADSPLPLRLWLRQIAIDRVKMAERTHLRTEKRGLHRELQLPNHSSMMLAQQLLGIQPDDHLARLELIQAVRSGLAELAETDREILTMRTFEDLSYEEVALIIGVSPAVARQRHGRALLRLSKHLKDDIDST